MEAEYTLSYCIQTLHKIKLEVDGLFNIMVTIQQNKQPPKQPMMGDATLLAAVKDSMELLQFDLNKATLENLSLSSVLEPAQTDTHASEVTDEGLHSVADPNSELNTG